MSEVVNYVRAMNYGLERLSDLPLSLRLVREIHAELLRDVRGAEHRPGEFRQSQNGIGPANTPLARATFVPPPVPEMLATLDNLEQFLHDAEDLPVLIQCGLAHAQFETIHPFLDGNDRVGRLLITFLLVHRQVLHRPLLYLSHYLKAHRTEYYDRLQAVRETGDWEGWLRFFLRAVAETAEEATATARAILALREQHRARLHEHGAPSNSLRLLDLLYQRPLVNVRLVQQHLGVTFVTASKLVEQCVQLALLEEITGGQRNRLYRYTPYVALFTDTAEPASAAAPVQTTESEALTRPAP